MAGKRKKEKSRIEQLKEENKKLLEENTMLKNNDGPGYESVQPSAPPRLQMGDEEGNSGLKSDTH